MSDLKISSSWLSVTRRKMLGSLLASIGWLLSGVGIPALAKEVKIKRRRHAVLIPPSPKWDRSVDGLESAFHWAADYQRSLMPPDTIFPREGQVWETVSECEVYLHFADGRLVGQRVIARLQEGERVRITAAEGPKPIQVDFQPVRYRELEGSIVPHDMRQHPFYTGYWLSAKTAKTIADFDKNECPAFFNGRFRLVKDCN